MFPSVNPFIYSRSPSSLSPSYFWEEKLDLISPRIPSIFWRASFWRFEFWRLFR